MPRAWIVGDEPKELATVRISKVVLEHFKSVRYGEVTFNCGRRFVPAGTESDILGLYGQNGSGKTSLIEALHILKCLLSGSKVPDQYVECIAADSDSARLSYEFDFQYPDGRSLKVGYEASICAEPKPEEDRSSFDLDEIQLSHNANRIRVFDEIVKMGGLIDGEKRQFRSCIDTLNASSFPFGPTSRHADYYKVSKASKDKLSANRILASERSQSFIFMDETMSMFYQDGQNESEFFQVLSELNLFARNYLFVVDSRFGASYSSDYLLPLFTRRGFLPLRTSQPMIAPSDILIKLKETFDSINLVLGELVPGLSVGIKELGPALLKSGKEGVSIEFVSKRGELEFPLRDESDGIKKIISVLTLFVAAFNEKSTTVAIDEFDAGVFEFLLGEMLQILEDSGRGQFIFTSHNLRPLEVLSKEFICFTTTNPDNRYYRMKNVGANNNLRDVYFREIIVDEQDEELYDSGKRSRIISALRMAASEYAI